MADITRQQAIEILKERCFEENTRLNRATRFGKALQFAIDSLEVDEAYQLEYERTTKSTFPAIVGAPAEMLFGGKWIKGKIVEGYRFDDGIVTIETSDGKQYWCGQDRTDCYRPLDDRHKQNIQAYVHDFGASEEQAEKELRPTKATWQQINKNEVNAIPQWKCSNCGAEFQCFGMDFEYCPHCGFRMEDDDD